MIKRYKLVFADNNKEIVVIENYWLELSLHRKIREIRNSNNLSFIKWDKV